MLYENNHTLDCGVLGKLEAQISFDFDETHRFNESVYVDGLDYWCSKELATNIVSSLMEEIRGTKEYKECL